MSKFFPMPDEQDSCLLDRQEKKNHESIFVLGAAFGNGLSGMMPRFGSLCSDVLGEFGFWKPCY